MSALAQSGHSDLDSQGSNRFDRLPVRDFDSRSLVRLGQGQDLDQTSAHNAREDEEGCWNRQTEKEELSLARKFSHPHDEGRPVGEYERHARPDEAFLDELVSECTAHEVH
jgi:hypothetical protein